MDDVDIDYDRNDVSGRSENIMNISASNKSGERSQRHDMGDRSEEVNSTVRLGNDTTEKDVSQRYKVAPSAQLGYKEA